MAAAAVLSIRSAIDLDSCRVDVLNFLRMLSWHNVCVEVERWRKEGLLHTVRRWESVAPDLEGLAQEVAGFIVGNEAAETVTVLVRH
jgi:hypothetical protein